MDKEQSLKNMAQMPVGKLILSTGIPMIISMVLQAFYNIVDSAFVSNMAQNGEDALNALTLAFPVQILIVAIGIGTGVGTNALVSRTLGEGNREKAARAAGCSVFLAFVIYLLTVIFGVFAVKPYISSQTKNPLIYDMAVKYLRICCIISFGNIFFAIFEKLLQSTGLSLYSSIAQIFGAVINIILDPIMIYGLFGCKPLGVSGAAYATVIGQIASFLLALVFHIKFNGSIKITVKSLKPSANLIRGIYSIGLPAIIAQALMSFMTYGLNIILVTINEGMVTAYGLYYKLQQFLLFAAFGMRDALTPVISFGYGQMNKKRIRAAVKCGVCYTSVIMLAGVCLLEIFAHPLAAVFKLSGETEIMYISAIRIISVSLLFAGVNISLQGAFQGLEAGVQTLAISVMRQLLFVIPPALIFAHIAASDAALSWTVWLTFIISEGLSCVFALIFMRGIYKTKIGV